MRPESWTVVSAKVKDMDSASMPQLTTTTLSGYTNAGLGGRAVCSSGLPCPQRSPTPMEYVSHEGG
jgi:hypothetical protein